MARRGVDASPAIAVDARLLRASGIGVYLQNLLRRMSGIEPTLRFVLLGRQQEITRLWDSVPSNIEVVEYEPQIYSLAQQWSFPVREIWGCQALWVPPYDIPLIWPLLGRRLIVTVHDVAHLAMPEIFSGAAKQLYAK